MTRLPLFDKPTRSLKDRILAFRWGGSSLISLYISILSGIVIALLYNPAEPFYSTTVIELIAPYGSFWRGMHYYSSQAFFLLLLCHFGTVVWENTHYYSRTAWIRLTTSLPLTLLLLFTGYILRDDATGEAAGLIGENIMLSIPLIGDGLNSLLLAVTTSGVTRVYANHLAGLMVIGTFCVWPHLRRYSSHWRSHLLLVGFIFFLSIALPPPLEPQRFGLIHIAGPWFFLGLQEALRYIPSLWAGVVFPGIIIAALLYLPHKGRGRTYCFFLIGAWLTLYAVLSTVSYLRF